MTTSYEEDITSPAYAVTLGERMDDAIARQAHAARGLIQWKQIAQQSRELMKALEAEVVINGGVGEIVLDGKNAEQRASQLTAALNRHEQYTKTVEKLRAAEREAQEAEADIDTTTNEIRLCRTLLDFGRSVNDRMAAMEATNGWRRNQ